MNQQTTLELLVALVNLAAALAALVAAVAGPIIRGKRERRRSNHPATGEEEQRAERSS